MIEKILNLLFEREDIKREQDNVIYMKRWFVFRLFGHRLCIHKMIRPDYDKCQHTHPWIGFWTFIIYGGYVEEIPNNKTQARKPFRLYICNGSHPHRITSLFKNYCYTLVYMRPKCREWGFLTRQGWMHHKEFLSKPHMSAKWCGDE